MADFSFFLPLPKKAKVLVKKGEIINEGQKVATFNRYKKHQINLSRETGLPPQKISPCLLVKLGQKITKDEPIAKTSSLFKKTIVSAPVSGQILALDQNTGILTIETIGKNRELLSSFPGKIENISQEGITILVQTERIIDLKKVWGDNVFGQLAFHNGTLNTFDHQYQNKIVLVEQLYPALLNKSQAIGCPALISTDNVDPALINLEQITIVQIDPEKEEELKKFIEYRIIIDNQQKKIAVLKK